MSPSADDLEVLHPERPLTIAGREITVREYGFVEGLRLQHLTEPIVNDLKGIVGDRVPTLDEVLVILGRNADAVVSLMATAADVEEQWVADLNQGDGHLLLMRWWGCNGPFYIRSARLRWLADQVRAGAMSTLPSSPPDTAAPTTSAE